MAHEGTQKNILKYDPIKLLKKYSKLIQNKKKHSKLMQKKL